MARLAEEHEDVDALFELLGGEVRLYDVDVEAFGGEDAHLFVGAEVVGGERAHFVEDVAEVDADFFFHENLLLEEEKLVHPTVDARVFGQLCDWVHLLELGDEDAMDLAAQVFLDEAADRLDHVFGECFEDFFLVIVDTGLCTN